VTSQSYLPGYGHLSLALFCKQMNLLIGSLLFAIFLFLSVLHAYWGFGGRWASQAVFPTKDDQTAAVMPGAGPTFIVAIGLLAIGLFIIQKAARLGWPLPVWLDQYGLWLIAGLFLVRSIGDFRYVGFFKTIRYTAFGRNDTAYYSPLCLIIGILTLVVALNA